MTVDFILTTSRLAVKDEKRVEGLGGSSKCKDKPGMKETKQKRPQLLKPYNV